MPRLGDRRRSARRLGRGRSGARGFMVAAASAVVAIGAVTGAVSALGEGRPSGAAKPPPTAAPTLRPLPAVPTASRRTAAPSPSASAVTPSATASPRPTPSRTAAAPARLYSHPDSQVREWLDAHPGDARRDVIASRIADRPAAVWFADFTPSTVTARVRAVTSSAAAARPGPRRRAVRRTAARLRRRLRGRGARPRRVRRLDRRLRGGSRLRRGRRRPGTRLDRAVRVPRRGAAQRPVRLPGPRRPGPEGGRSPGARLLRRRPLRLEPGRPAGRTAPPGQARPSAASSDGIFTNVSNFNRTSEETGYARSVLAALGGPRRPGRRHRHQPQRQRGPGRRRVVRPVGPKDRAGAHPGHRGGAASTPICG